MYLKHFGLNEFPFSLTPDTQFYLDLPSHREALNVLLLALQNGEGFIKITGDVGTGKTMLCRKLLNELKQPFVTAYIPNPHLTPSGLRLAVAEELGISYCKTASQRMDIADELGLPQSRENGQSRIVQHINDYLIKAAKNQQKTVIIIDEAQAMSEESLEALRLLTNLETEKQKLLQIVLIGQPELDDVLQKKSIRQLRQRISFSYKLKPLTISDIKVYLKHRLSIANIQNPVIFSQAAIHAIHSYSQGIPRLINILAHKSLLSAYGKDQTEIRLQHIKQAAKDTDETSQRLHPLEIRKRFLIALTTSLSLLAIQNAGILP